MTTSVVSSARRVRRTILMVAVVVLLLVAVFLPSELLKSYEREEGNPPLMRPDTVLRKQQQPDGAPANANKNNNNDNNSMFLKTSGGGKVVLDDTDEAARAAQTALSAVFPERHVELKVNVFEDTAVDPQQQQQQTGENDNSNNVEGARIVDEVNGLPLPFPVYDKPDDRVPGIAAVTSSTSKVASEQLECRNDITSYVVDATDVKDECDGLRRAFDAHCARIGEDSHAAGQAAVQQQQQQIIQQQQQQTQNHHHFKGFGHQRKLQAENTESIVDRLTQAWNKVMSTSFDNGKENHDHININFSRRLEQEAIEQHKKHQQEQKQQQQKMHAVQQNEQHMQELVKQQQHEAVQQMQLQQLQQEQPQLQETVRAQQQSPPVTTIPNSLTLPTTSQHIPDQILSSSLNLMQVQDPPLFVTQQSGNNPQLQGQPQRIQQQQQQQQTPAEHDVHSFFATLQAEELKTCCSSIMTVFHEHCDRPVEDELNDSKLFVIVSVIAICLLVKSLIKTFRIRWLPEAAGCILVGAVGGIILEFVPHVYFGFDEKLFLRVMLPPIVFEAALNIDKRAFIRHAIPITLYACVGTLLSSFIVASIVHYTSAFFASCVTIPFIESLAFGALISSIDPVAVLSVLSNMGMSNTDAIYVLVFGESLLNDGVAIVLFDTLVLFLDANVVIDAAAVTEATVHFLVVAVGSIFMGLLCGGVCTAYFWAMYGCHSPLVEVLTFFCWALIPFYVCDGMGWSGIVALVAAGFVMDLFVVGSNCGGAGAGHGGDVAVDPNVAVESAVPIFDLPPHLMRQGVFRKAGHLSTTAKIHVGFVTEINSTMMETAIFAYLGLFLFSARYHWNFLLSMIAIVACLVSRAIMIPLLSTWANYWIKSNMMRQKKRDLFRTRSCDPEHNTGNGDNVGKLEENASDSPPPERLLIIDRHLQLVLWFSGLRGAMSFALVENVPLFDKVTKHGSMFKSEMKSMTCASILFTVFVLGGGTYYLMDYLGIKSNDSNGSTASNGTSEASANSKVEMMPLMGQSEHEYNNTNEGQHSIYRRQGSVK